MEKLIVSELSKSEFNRIFSKISINPKNNCWEWIGARDFQGYGMTFYRGKKERIHRLIYAYLIDSIPRGIDGRKILQIDHLCRNTCCCNPCHLEAVSQKENGFRGNGIQAINHRKTHCKHGHILIKHPVRNRRYCPQCDSLSHKINYRKMMDGPNRNYYLKRQNEASMRYYYRKKKLLSTKKT